MLLNACRVLLWLIASTLSEAAEESQPLRVFFIGNSLTYWADLPGQVATFAESRGLSLQFNEQIRSGQDMRHHWETGASVGAGKFAAAARSALTEKSWHAVVIQPMSREFMPERRDSFFEYTSRFVGLIPEETTIFLYVYWPYLTEPLDEQDTINSAFEEVRSLLATSGKDIRLLPVGEAFRQAVELGLPRESLYLDELHASNEGMYLAALVKFATLFGQDPRGLGAQAVNAKPGRNDVVPIDPETAKLLQTAAWKASNTRSSHRAKGSERP